MYNPQNNDVVERKNQTIMNMPMNVIKAKNMSNEFWVEAIASSVYILNRSPKISVKGKVPQQVEWKKIKYISLWNFWLYFL